MNQKRFPWERWFAALTIIIIGVLIAVTRSQVRRPVTIAWEPLGGPTRTIVWAMAVDPRDPRVIYAGVAERGIFKSRDGGTTWEQKNNGLESVQGAMTGDESAREIRDILISRTDPDVVYVATWGPEGIYFSEDGGESWTAHFLDVWETGDEDDLELTSLRVQVRALAETESDILAGTGGGVFRLIGREWGTWQPTELKGEDMSVRALLVHPDRRQTVYAATLGQGIHKSVDGGLTWSAVGAGLESEAAQRVNALKLDPEDPAVMYAGTFGDGVYRSLDGGEAWEAWNEGMPEEAQVWSLQFALDGTLFAGLRFGGTYKRARSGEWQEANFPYGALTLNVDPQGGIYAGTWGGGVFRNANGTDEASTDWQHLGPPTSFLRFSTAVFAGGTLYVGTHSDGIYASEDGGQSWEQRGASFGESQTVFTVSPSPDGGTLYAGTGDGVFFTNDGGKEWDLLGADTLAEEELLIVSLLVSRNRQGQDVVFAGTRRGLWVFDPGSQSWRGPAPFEPEPVAWVPSLLTEDGDVYASVWGWGVQKSANLGDSWRRVEMAPRFVSALALGDKTWLQWGGEQFYALTERGLYGSSNGDDWRPLDPVLLETIATDPRHPQVAYGNTVPDTALDSETITTTEIVTSTLTLASVSDGRGWKFTDPQDASPIQGRVATLVRDPGDRARIFALIADGGLHRGQVRLPWLMQEVVVWWLLGLTGFLAFVVAPYGYFNLVRTYGLSHRQARGLLKHPRALFRIRSQRFQNRLKPLEKLILATLDQPSFRLVDAWQKLDEIGVYTSRSLLIRALGNLVEYGLVREREGDYRFFSAGLQVMATVEFQESEDALLEDVRRENRLLNEVEGFFEAAGFDVRQDVPQHLTGFVLRPFRKTYRGYGQLYAWLRSDGPLQGEEVDLICQEAVEKYGSSSRESGAAEDRVPIAFAVVTELPKVDAFQKIRVWRERLRLLVISTTMIRTALRERSAMRDLDILVQQERDQADLFDLRAPVMDQLDFYGRKENIARIKACLRVGKSVDVWSPPGMGKTSFLWHLKETLVGPLVAYADLTFGWPGRRLFQEQILSDLASDLRLKYNRFFDTGILVDFEERLLSLIQAVPARGERDVRVVLLFDGLSVQSSDEKQNRFLESLRQLTDAHLNVALVVTWGESEVSVSGWETLGTLDQMESTQLMTAIGAQMGLEFTEETLATVYHETGGHPLLLRQLGSAIARQAPDRLPPTEFGQVIPDWVDQALAQYHLARERYFEEVWQWISLDQRNALRTWNQMTDAEREHLRSVNPYLRALMESKVLWNLLVSWTSVHVEENHI